MKIERIDDKTVKCFISNEELEEFDITYKDFIERSEKAKEIVEEIIERAVEEVGYKPPQYALDLQLMMLPEKGMLITLSEKTPEDLKNNPMMQAYLQEMKKTLEEHFEEIAEQVRNKNATSSQKQEPNHPDFAVFEFAGIRDLNEFAKILPKNLRVESSLYRMNQSYFLYLKKGGASYERYSRACIQAMEYGVLHSAAKEKLVYLKEHGECLIEEKAVAKLRF